MRQLEISVNDPGVSAAARRSGDVRLTVQTTNGELCFVDLPPSVATRLRDELTVALTQ